jgi:hypothetical protein
MTTPLEPGWYDDPQEPTAQRYWDGQDWTPKRQRKPMAGGAQPRVVPTEVPGMPAQPSLTSQPRAADWYPDPSGKPGLMYWDGQQWHTDTNTPDAHRPSDDEVPPRPTSTTPQPQRPRALIAVLVVTVVALVAGLGIASYLLLRHSPASQTPTALPAPTSTTPVSPITAPPPAAPAVQPSVHYIKIETISGGQSINGDWYLTPCGDGCASIATTPGGQPWAQARLVNGQWVADGSTEVVCADGSNVPDGNASHYTWDPNTLAGTDQITRKLASCGVPAGDRYSTSVQFRQEP